MNGNKPSDGTITIKDGQVTTDSTMTVGDYTVAYNPTNKKYEATKKGSTSTGDDKPTNPDTPTTSTVVYRWSEDPINIGDTMNDQTKYTKDASTLGRNYCLKHVLDKDNKVTESYACAILKGKEYCLTNGEYGYSESETDYTGSVLLLKQIEDAKIEGIDCVFGTDNSGCDDGSGGLDVYSDGSVHAGDYDSNCYVNAGGSSICAGY